MSVDHKGRKRSRWGADLDSDPSETGEMNADLEPASANVGPESSHETRSPQSKRKKSRWGGDKPEASDAATAPAPHLADDTGSTRAEDASTEPANGTTPAPHGRPAGALSDLLPSFLTKSHSSSPASLVRKEAAALPAESTARSQLPNTTTSAGESLQPPRQEVSSSDVLVPAVPATLAVPADPLASPGAVPVAEAALQTPMAANPTSPAPQSPQSHQSRPGKVEGPPAALSAPAPPVPASEAEEEPGIPGGLSEDEPGVPGGLSEEEPELPGGHVNEEGEKGKEAPAEAHGIQDMPKEAQALPAEGAGSEPPAQGQDESGERPPGVGSPGSEALPLPPPPRLVPLETKAEPCTLIVNAIRAEANEQSLRLLFESAGKVLGCKLVKDAATGGHKGFGFVMMATQAEAETAVEKLHKLLWGDKELEVTLKLPGAPKERPAPAAAAAPWNAGSQTEGSAPWSAAAGAGGSLPMSLPQSGQGASGALPAAPSYGYSPYDPYAAAYGYYGYGYDPYAAYAQYGAVPNGALAADPGAQEDEKPPGMEDDEAPPGVETAGDGTAEGEPAAPGSESQAEGDPEGAGAAPPPPPPPKKEPTVIHVPLKVPEGARKKQEERKRAREEKAQQLAAAAEVAALSGAPVEENVPSENEPPAKEGVGQADAAAARAAALIPSKPVVVGTKGSFQEVLARRQAELAAIKAGKGGGPAKRGREPSQPPSRAGRRGRSLSRSPPPRQAFARRRRLPSRSPSGSRSPVRHPHARPRSPSGSFSRSPSYARSQSQSPARHARRSRSRSVPLRAAGVPQGIGPPAEWDRPSSPSLSPSRRKEKRKSKEKKKDREKRKHRRDKRRRTREDSLPLESAPSENPAPDVRQSIPHVAEVAKPGPGWVEVPFQEEPARPITRDVVLPPVPRAQEPYPPAEPPAFRKPGRRRVKTRWHEDDVEKDGQASDEPMDAPPASETRRERRRHRDKADQRRAVAAEDGQTERASPPPRAVPPKRKPSPQVSEEGEIPLEEGEIEGELGELPTEPSPEPRPAELDRYPEYGGGGYSRRHEYDDNEYSQYGSGYRGGYRGGRSRGRGRGGYGSDRYAGGMHMADW